MSRPSYSFIIYIYIYFASFWALTWWKPTLVTPVILFSVCLLFGGLLLRYLLFGGLPLFFVPFFGQVVPDPLLDFCFNVMRSAFSVTLNRPVYAFKFDRFMEVTPAILEKVGTVEFVRNWLHAF